MTSQLELRFSCQKLKNLDFLSKSDPVVQVFQQKHNPTTSTKSFEFVGQTEIIKDNLSPEFKEPILVDYYFQEQQIFLLKVLDVDATVDASVAAGTGGNGNGTVSSSNQTCGIYVNKPDFKTGKTRTYKISKADTIGEAFIYLAEVASSAGMTVQRKLELGHTRSSQFRGAITVRAEEVDGNRFDSRFTLNFSNVSLTNFRKPKSFFNTLFPCLPSPHLRIWICKVLESGHEQVVFKSNILFSYPQNWSNFVLNDFHIPLQAICNNDRDRPLKIKLYDERHPDRAKLLSEAHATVNALFQQMESDTISKTNNGALRYGAQVILKDVRDPPSTSKSETALNFALTETRQPSFLDFVRGGLNLNLHVGIDFTASNGDPKLDPNSLHFMGGGCSSSTNPNICVNNGKNASNALNGYAPSQNQYERVLSAVGYILREYDSDKIIPAYGFGAKCQDLLNSAPGNPQYHTVSHCFPLNVPESRSDCVDVGGLLQTYKNCALPYVKFSGPTLFAPLLKTILDNSARREAALGGGLSDYHIILILTDGVIHDMDQTIQEVVDSSNLPVSVIIVGVGNADFGNMETLDADGAKLYCNSTQRHQARDQVQFVPFNSVSGSGARLQSEVLKELPSQVCEYFKMRNVAPGPPRVAHGIVGQSHGVVNGASGPPMVSKTADFSHVQSGIDPATVLNHQGSVFVVGASAPLEGNGVALNQVRLGGM